MSYQVDLIYDITYTRNNQIIFPANLTGVKKVTINCEGKFFTYQRTIRAYWSVFSEVAHTKNIVGARVIPDNGEEFYYFVTGFAFVAPNVVEFNIEPDYFHTYLNNAGCKLSLLKTNHEPAINNSVCAFYREPKTVLQDRMPLFKVLTPENKYYVAGTLALDETTVLNVLLTSKFPSLTAARNDAGLLSYTVKYERDIITTDAEGNPQVSKVSYNAKLLRTFIFPESLVQYIAASAGESPYVKYYVVEKMPDGDETRLQVVQNGNQNTMFDIDITNFLYKELRVGTQFDNISIKHNFLIRGKAGVATIRVFVDLDTIGAYLFSGDTQLDILRGFELDTNASATAQYKAQQGISDAIQKVGGIAGAVGSIGAGVAAAGMGNYLQAGLSITSGATQFAGTLARDIEREKRVTANAGGNVGVANLSGDWHGLSCAIYSVLDELAIKNELELYGNTFSGDIYSVTSFKNEITKRTFFLAQSVYDFTASIPAPAATELEQTFISGIFISPFIAQ